MVTFSTAPPDRPNSALMELVCTLNSWMASGGGPITKLCLAAQIFGEAVVVHAIQNVIVLVRPHAVGAESAGVLVARARWCRRGSGRQHRQAREEPAVQRQVHDPLAVHHFAEVGGVRLEDRSGTRPPPPCPSTGRLRAARPRARGPAHSLEYRGRTELLNPVASTATEYLPTSSGVTTYSPDASVVVLTAILVSMLVIVTVAPGDNRAARIRHRPNNRTRSRLRPQRRQTQYQRNKNHPNDTHFDMLLSCLLFG